MGHNQTQTTRWRLLLVAAWGLSMAMLPACPHSLPPPEEEQADAGHVALPPRSFTDEWEHVVDLPVQAGKWSAMTMPDGAAVAWDEQVGSEYTFRTLGLDEAAPSGTAGAVLQLSAAVDSSAGYAALSALDRPPLVLFTGLGPRFPSHSHIWTHDRGLQSVASCRYPDSEVVGAWTGESLIWAPQRSSCTGACTSSDAELRLVTAEGDVRVVCTGFPSTGARYTIRLDPTLPRGLIFTSGAEGEILHFTVQPDGELDAVRWKRSEVELGFGATFHLWPGKDRLLVRHLSGRGCEDYQARFVNIDIEDGMPGAQQPSSLGDLMGDVVRIWKLDGGYALLGHEPYTGECNERRVLVLTGEDGTPYDRVDLMHSAPFPLPIARHRHQTLVFRHEVTADEDGRLRVSIYARSLPVR